MDMDFLSFMDDGKGEMKLFSESQPPPVILEDSKEDIKLLEYQSGIGVVADEHFFEQQVKDEVKLVDSQAQGMANDDSLFENQPSNAGPIRSNSISGRRNQRNQTARLEVGASAQLDINVSPSLPPQHPQQSKSSAVPHPLKRGGRRSSKTVDPVTKLERSRQSARECRARKKLRYQYLEDLVKSREQAVFSVRKELEQIRQWVHEMDETGKPPEGLLKLVEEDLKKTKQKSQSQHISMDTLSME